MGSRWTQPFARVSFLGHFLVEKMWIEQGSLCTKPPVERCGKKHEERAGFKVTSDQSARRVSSLTIDGERSRLRCGSFWIVSVNSRANFPAFARSMRASGADKPG